jgi:hypothetical protein
MTTKNVNGELVMAEFCKKIPEIESATDFDRFCLDTRTILGELLCIEPDEQAQKWLRESIETVRNMQINAKLDRYAQKWGLDL